MTAQAPPDVSEEALFLSGTVFLGHVPPADLERLVPYLRRVSCARGEAIFSRGGTPAECFFVIDGTVKARVQTDDGRELIYLVWSRGESFGVYDILWNLGHSVDAIALEPVELYAIDAQAFLSFMNSEPRWLAQALIAYSFSRRHQFERVQDLILLQGRERLCKAIARYAAEMDASGMQVLKRPMSQGELAAFTGNSRESVNRWLKALAHEGIIRVDRGGIVVLKPDELRRQYPRFD
jgi:CRP/FNR family transcriptional regulator